MQNPITPAALALAALCLAPTAVAQGVYAEFYSTSNPGDGWAALPGFPNQDAGQPGLDSGSDILIEILDSATVRVFADDPANTDIGLITLHTNPSQVPTLIVGKPLLPRTSETSPIAGIACRTLAGITTNERTRVQVTVRNITGPGIDVHQLIRLDLAGNLDAPVVHWGDKAGAPPKLGAVSITGNVTTNGSIAAYQGQIGPITIGGDLNGNIAALSASITSIDIAGSIGAQGKPSITATSPSGTFALDHLVVQGDIGRPDARVDIVLSGAVRLLGADAIHADIDLESIPANPGYLAAITTRTGDFTGSLRARTLTSFGGWSEAPCLIKIAGDMNADIKFTNGIRNERPNGPEIDIAGSIGQDASIVIGSLFNTDSSLPAGEIQVRTQQGLAGQIVIGRGDEQDFPDLAKVTVGQASPRTVTNITKHYTDLFADFGGGAVGIAPFNFHQIESFPVHNSTTDLNEQELLVAVAPRFFGPVYAVDAPMHMIIEHLAEGSQSWADRSNEFTVQAPTEEIQGSRTIVVRAIAPSSFGPGQWRLRPIDGALKSALAIGNPDVKFVSEYSDNTYRFNVTGGSDCPQPGGRTNNNEIEFENSSGIIQVNCP